MGKKQLWFIMIGVFLGMHILIDNASLAYAAPPPEASTYDAYPPFMANNPPPLVMLVMGRDHKLYYEAYNDASDLDGDGVLDTTYKPDQIDYYGYFDSNKYYKYDGSGLFVPAGLTADKKVPAGNYWSGDFLNYLTMSRMDALRKVLYGGYRSTDTATETVLQRAYIPQDAHSWGKEYKSVAHDGYDIQDYTPLGLPQNNTRHLFANTTLSDNGDPLLRVLNDSNYRIWEWVSIERPVAGKRCVNGGSGPDCTTPGGTQYDIVPNSSTAGISNTTHTTYSLPGSPSHPGSHSAYDTFVATYAIAGNYQGEVPVSTINGSGNPSGADDYYLSIFNGTLNIDEDGTYTFSVDGDDAVELLIDVNKDGDFDDAGEVVTGYYGGHGACGCNTYNGSISLTAGSYTFQFRHEELSGGDNYYLRWQLNLPSSSMTDYQVRVKVADPSWPETNCKKYPDGNYKPTGLLQRHGETNSMYFGLITGSYTKNTSGGVLRKNISSITDEINPDTGQLAATNGIIQTINKLRIVDFSYSDYSYNSNCGWVTTRAIDEGECRMWGNPVGEMMYESLRYFAGENATSDFLYSDSNDNSAGMGLTLPKPNWVKPYAEYPSCSKPFILTISDIYPSYDSDQLPGSAFGGPPAASIGAAGPLDVETIADMIFGEEESAGDRFIGQQGATYDGACTAKSVDGFGDIRGLCPEEPTKQGSYYSAAVAHYGRTEDINSADGNQEVDTYAVALASPLPNIDIQLQGKTVRLVPFAKSVGGASISASEGSFQPTNTIVDFYVAEIQPHYGRFRINFEDVEQGADHDMDAIIVYEYQLLDVSDNPVTEATIDQAVKVKITLTSEYAAGGIIQHCGYIISGTTNDGTFLEVRDVDTAAGSDPDYFLDTPNTTDALPLANSRTFTVDPSGGSSAAALLPNPLWYAAKWGGFDDENDNGLPDQQSEWDRDNDGVPDNYFYVVNPLKLEEQLNKSFADILAKTSSGTAAAVVANNSEGQGTMLQAFFKPEFVSSDASKLRWLGYLQSLWVDEFGHLREDTNHDFKLNFDTDLIIEYYNNGDGNAYINRYDKHYHYNADNQQDAECVVSDCDTHYETFGIEDIEPIFAAGKMLYERTTDRNIFTFIDGNGEDDDLDGKIDQSGEAEGANTVGKVENPGESFNDGSGELIQFSTANADLIKPYLGVKDDTAFSYLETGGPDHDTRVKNLIDYIRGKDSADLTGNPNTRNRTFDGKTWKLGDIVRSTPVNVAGATESYDLIYNDESYLVYLREYAHRESVVYAGANDGMLHAFSHGRYGYDSDNDEYGYEQVDGTPIGEELWAYLPQSLLAHLKWLADPSYGHAFYVDSKPKVFDARVFDVDDTHPGGWGTIMIVGLGAGGKKIWAEGDFGTGSDEIRWFYPTYVCMDITDPRNPRLLWERSYENLGMTTSYPTVVQVGATYNSSSSEWSGGQWYAAFGSGPNDDLGKTDYNGYSDQNGYVFVVDIKTGKELQKFNTGLGNAVMSSPASLDKGSDSDTSPVNGLTYNVDAIYIGSANYSGGQWDGTMFKINTRSPDSVPSVDPGDWTFYTLFESPAPITAAPSLSVDTLDNVWVLFGTGRFQEMADRVTTDQNYLFGIKDPYFNTQYDASDSEYNSRGDYYHDNGQVHIPAIGDGDLFYSNPYVSYSAVGTVSGGLASITSWDSLLQVVRNTDSDNGNYFDGWYRELDPRPDISLPSERIISKPAILSGLVFAPVYIPDEDICAFGGSTDTYGVYYETGTSMWKHIFRTGTTENGDPVAYRAGKILNTGPPPPTVSIHIGKQEGAKLFTQTGGGQVLEATVDIPPVESNIQYWTEP
jgi:type IV pilus assembly protein PilY1